VTLQVRQAGVSDEAFILALNAACVPMVGEMTPEHYRRMLGWAWRVLVADVKDTPVAFMILIRPGAAYPSDNYRWFEQALYARAAELAIETKEERLTAEVNEDPPNPDSMAFHRRMGFHPLATRLSGSGKTVVMLERAL
jgi:predicted GNAT superfamily acetyltransferase